MNDFFGTRKFGAMLVVFQLVPPVTIAKLRLISPPSANARKTSPRRILRNQIQGNLTRGIAVIPRYGCFLKWWYLQNTPKWSFLVGKPRGCWVSPCITILGNPHIQSSLTLPETNSKSPWKVGPPKGSRIVFQPSIFKCHGFFQGGYISSTSTKNIPYPYPSTIPLFWLGSLVPPPQVYLNKNSSKPLKHVIKHELLNMTLKMGLYDLNREFCSPK